MLNHTFCNAQYIQLLPGNAGAYDGVDTNDMTLLSQSEVINLDNAAVSGNAFLDENWKTAFLYTDRYTVLLPRVKLNLYKNG